MHESECCLEVRRQLARHGLPAERIERIVRELAEHWEDLRDAALQRGLAAPEAAREADSKLGCPKQLSVNVICGLKRSSWIGRHPVLALCVLPFFLTPFLMALIVLPVWGVDELIHFSYWGGSTSGEKAHLIVPFLNGLYHVMTLVAPASFCWLVWRAGLGMRWIPAVCSWCAFTALLRFFSADVSNRNVSMGFRFPWSLNFQTASILFLHALIAVAFCLVIRESTRRAIQPMNEE